MSPTGSPPRRSRRRSTRCWRRASRAAAIPASSSDAVDWTDLESFSRPPKGDGRCADPEAAWGHRRGDSPGEARRGLLRLLPAGRHRGRGGPRPRGARAGAPHPASTRCKVDPPAALVPGSSGWPPPGSRSATCSPTPATPTGWRRRGRCRSAPRRRPRPGPASPRSRAEGDPHGGDPRQRSALLPRHPERAPGAGAAGARRHGGRDGRPRPQGHRARQIQARADRRL